MYTNFDLGRREKGITGYVWEAADPDSVLCIIHGLGSYAGRYDRLAGFMNASGITVVSADLPGHGRSSGIKGDCAPRSRVLDVISCMLLWAHYRYPGLPITLYGHSMGGGICLDYRDRGDFNDMPSKYIASSPWLALTEKVPKALYYAVRGTSKLRPETTLTFRCHPEMLGNTDYTGNYYDDPMNHPCITLRAAVDGYENGMEILQGLHETNHRGDDIPLLLMHGSADPICRVDGSRTYAGRHSEDPGFTYIEWPGYLHELHNGIPGTTGEEVMEKIRDFIKE